MRKTEKASFGSGEFRGFRSDFLEKFSVLLQLQSPLELLEKFSVEFYPIIPQKFLEKFAVELLEDLPVEDVIGSNSWKYS